MLIDYLADHGFFYNCPDPQSWSVYLLSPMEQTLHIWHMSTFSYDIYHWRAGEMHPLYPLQLPKPLVKPASLSFIHPGRLTQGLSSACCVCCLVKGLIPLTEMVCRVLVRHKLSLRWGKSLWLDLVVDVRG